MKGKNSKIRKNTDKLVRRNGRLYIIKKG